MGYLSAQNDQARNKSNTAFNRRSQRAVGLLGPLDLLQLAFMIPVALAEANGEIRNRTSGSINR